MRSMKLKIIAKSHKFDEPQIEQQGKKVLDTLSTTIESIGKDKFIFYDNGDIEYRYEVK